MKLISLYCSHNLKLNLKFKNIFFLIFFILMADAVNSQSYIDLKLIKQQKFENKRFTNERIVKFGKNRLK